MHYNGTLTNRGGDRMSQEETSTKLSDSELEDLVGGTAGDLELEPSTGSCRVLPQRKHREPQPFAASGRATARPR